LLDKARLRDDFPDPSAVRAAQSRAAFITELVARERPTLRVLLRQGHPANAGTHVSEYTLKIGPLTPG
jgi:hypothetical protein